MEDMRDEGKNTTNRSKTVAQVPTHILSITPETLSPGQRTLMQIMIS